MSSAPDEGLSLDQRDLPGSWHLKAVSVAALALLGAVLLAWKTLL